MKFSDFLDADSYDFSRSDKIYIKPNVPLDKARNAIGEYCGGVSYDDVVVLIDDTVFGNGKCGVLITDDAIYYHELLQRSIRMPFSKVKSITVKSGFLKSKVIINEEPSIDLTQPSYKKTKKVISDLNLYLNSYKADLIEIERVNKERKEADFREAQTRALERREAERKEAEIREAERREAERKEFPISVISKQYKNKNEPICNFIYEMLMIVGRLKNKYPHLDGDDLKSLVLMSFDFHLFLQSTKGFTKDPELSKLIIFPLLCLLEQNEYWFDDITSDFYGEEIMPLSIMNIGLIIQTEKENEYIQSSLFEQWCGAIKDLDFHTYVDTLDMIKRSSVTYMDAILEKPRETHNKLNSLLD